MDPRMQHGHEERYSSSYNSTYPLTPDYKKKFTVTTDTSDQALGAVISQDNKPIEFLSKKFSQQELNWTVYEKEIFAMVYAINRWRYYLQNGIPFDVVTDNMAVMYI